MYNFKMDVVARLKNIQQREKEMEESRKELIRLFAGLPVENQMVELYEQLTTIRYRLEKK